jgi:hypothetical protein
MGYQKILHLIFLDTFSLNTGNIVLANPSDTMKKAGFQPLSYEWRHFNGMPKDQARRKYHIIE